MANSHTETIEANDLPVKSDDIDGKFRKPQKRKNPTSNLSRRDRAKKRNRRQRSR